jgi:sugar-phosphatase
VRVKVEAKGLLFDMDGVLISSIASVNRCWRQWTKQYGIVGWESLVIPHGVRAVDVMRGLRPDFTDADVAKGLRIIEDLEIADTADLKILEGVRELLASLPPERWTIVTSATRRLLLGRLKAAGLPYPDELIAGDDVVNGKPHPEPYMKGAKMLGFSSAECIVVEDAPSGVGSGVAAGSRVLGVLGTHSAEELYGAGASWVVRSLDGVKATVQPEGLVLEFEQV